jgi:hypothetical protein
MRSVSIAFISKNLLLFDSINDRAKRPICIEPVTAIAAAEVGTPAIHLVVQISLKQTAEEFLSACRPGGEDAADPVFEEVLAQRKCDPEIRNHFAQ